MREARKCVNVLLFVGAKEVLAVGGGGNVYAFYMGVVVMVVGRSRVVVAAAGESERKL